MLTLYFQTRFGMIAKSNIKRRGLCQKKKKKFSELWHAILFVYFVSSSTDVFLRLPLPVSWKYLRYADPTTFVSSCLGERDFWGISGRRYTRQQPNPDSKLAWSWGLEHHRKAETGTFLAGEWGLFFLCTFLFVVSFLNLCWSAETGRSVEYYCFWMDASY